MLKIITVVLAAGILTFPCFAQIEKRTDPEPAKAETSGGRRPYFRLDFAIQEVDAGRVVNSRMYSMIVGPEHSRDSIRAGSQIPVGPPSAKQLMHVGINIDCQDAEELGNQLSLNVIAEVSNIAEDADRSTGEMPVLRTNNWNSHVLIPLRRPTVVFSSDDLASKRKMQVELTATPIQ